MCPGWILPTWRGSDYSTWSTGHEVTTKPSWVRRAEMTKTPRALRPLGIDSSASICHGNQMGEHASAPDLRWPPRSDEGPSLHRLRAASYGGETDDRVRSKQILPPGQALTAVVQGGRKWLAGHSDMVGPAGALTLW